MKLLFCKQCYHTFSLGSLGHKERSCDCGSVSGRYIDELNVEVSGDPIVLGFQNHSFSVAIRKQIALGDSTETMDYAGGKVIKGRPFEAFIIPDSADSVKRLDK